MIENNLIFNNDRWCMVVLNSNGAVIHNNVCYHNGIRQDGSGELSTCGNNLFIFNNILALGKASLHSIFGLREAISSWIRGLSARITICWMCRLMQSQWRGAMRWVH